MIIDGLKFETIQSMYNWSLKTVGRTWSIKYKNKLRDRVFRLEKILKEKPEIIQAAPLKQIASYLGITDTSLSRIRKELTEK